jgi:hypothetical protein
MNNIEFTHFVTRFFNIKSVLSKYLSIFFFLLLFLPSQVLAEGSKEIYIGTNSTGLQLCNDFISHCSSSGVDERTQFAVYECDSSDRLNFIVNSTHEIVYLGFQGQITVKLLKMKNHFRKVEPDILIISMKQEKVPNN